jgi:uncharacterized protein
MKISKSTSMASSVAQYFIAVSLSHSNFGTAGGGACALSRMDAELQAQDTPTAVISDPLPDPVHPATMASPDIPSHGAKMYAVIYIAAGEGPHPTVLMLHGFPGNEKNLDLAYSIRRAGWNVLVPFYRGAWGSGGTFSVTHTLEDAQTSIDFLRAPENAKLRLRSRAGSAATWLRGMQPYYKRLAK